MYDENNTIYDGPNGVGNEISIKIQKWNGIKYKAEA